ncbi:class IV adenylate cyclase [Amycolatopsis sp. cg5]|uniref:class IV adenylate cyclase n=1 Tax=Amycolatopsis sp. cg5 TaxID=3238802 RepID=UPI0035248E05
MAIEAELKALVREPDAVAHRLRQLGDEQPELYRDIYFDRPDHTVVGAGRELRVRVIESATGIRYLFTLKDAPVDEASGSKPEFETWVGDAATMREILSLLGYQEIARLTKNCRNYRFESGGRAILATLVTLSAAGDTFIEVETPAERADLGAALDVVRDVLTGLGIDKADITAETYTATMLRARGAVVTPRQ